MGLISVYTLPLAQNLLNEWFNHDIEQSSIRILNATQSTLIDHIDKDEKKQVKTILTQATQETQLFALGLCSQSNVFFEKTDNFPSSIDCKLNEFAKKIEYKGAEYFVRSKSLFSNKTFKGQLIIIYELDFIKSRNYLFKKYFIELIVSIGITITLALSFFSYILNLIPSKPAEKVTIPQTGVR